KQSENREAIFDVFVMYEKLLMDDNLTDWKTNAIRAWTKIKNGELQPKKYSYIIVDESQDLSRVQLEIIREMYADSDHSMIIFISDVAQSIYTQSWLSKQSFKSIGFDMSGKSNILSKNYRTTKQIALAAYSLINHDMDLRDNGDYVEPELIERSGCKPRYRHFTVEEKEFAYVTAEIKKCAVKYELKDIVVVARNQGYLNQLKSYLLMHGVDAELSNNNKSFSADKVKLFTLHSIKGLEASVVFIVGVNKGILPFSQEELDVERKLLYVGMTRAKELLYMTSSRKESVFITEIKQEYLQLSDNEKEDFYDISIENYRFFDKIKTINTEEERVRQWYLEQLEVKYGYPIQHMSVEALVKYGSKDFYVDIAVFEDDAKEIPLIYVETKRMGEDLQEALKQVKCYNVPGNAPKYIVVTDGVKQVVEAYKDETYTVCDDIPFYNKEEKECAVFQYYDFEHDRKMEYRQIGSDIPCLQNVLNDTQLDYTYLPIRGSIAAGNLKYVNVEHGSEEIIPIEAVKNPDMKFVLQVSGDSMVDFNILDGDRIIVKKQAFAQEGSIIVGGNMAMNEATVKQLHYDGDDHVVLHPGNKKYQDIIIKVEDFYINGVVVGVIRKK
ncbi:MAG: type I restriction enzyme HsdR N-terminal domain-containing protein, partial [Clostridium sp.]|nr:type I restriction enzyme HsdR N-terminal domain-containing protein [Clostridium sp.]